jgi:hypothetical protein
VTRAKSSPVVDALFFATLFTVTFAKLQWEVAGTLSLSDVLTALFLAVYATTRLGTGDRRLAWGAVVAALFFLAFLTVYLVGFFNLGTEEALAQWAKGMVKFLLHFLFLVAGIAYLVRRSERFYWTTFAVFMAGFVANAAYGIVQLGTAEVLGINLDQSLLQPLTGGASQINIYGAIEGASVFRPNALTGDPNHLGIELVIPLLVLTPLYLRLERGHRLRVPLACVLAFLLVVELATLSRSPTGASSSRRPCSSHWEGSRLRSASSSRRAGTSSSRCCAPAWTPPPGGPRRTSTSMASSRTSCPRTRSSGSG